MKAVGVAPARGAPADGGRYFISQISLLSVLMMEWVVLLLFILLIILFIVFLTSLLEYNCFTKEC